MLFRFTRKTLTKPVDDRTRAELVQLVKDLTRNRPDMRQKLADGITITASRSGGACDQYRVVIDADRETVEAV